ncbi:MAG: hypothetical protein IT213_08670 [Cytophagales bacterium]|jgi:hypothetical protein|nr:hypothetical protein [Cytophagales bacterium]
MELSQNRVEFKLVHAVLLLMIILFVSFILIRRTWFLREHRFTIGLTTGTESASKMGTYVVFKYRVGEIDYTGSRPLEGYRPIAKDGRYYVIFSIADPETENILWDQPVPDHIKEAPPEGWSEIPK